MSTHKLYELQYVNTNCNGFIITTVLSMTGQTDSVLSILLSEVIRYGDKFLDEIIAGVSEYLISGQHYNPNFDFLILGYSDSDVLIRWDDDPIEKSTYIPAEDFLNLLLELREYRNQEPEMEP
jgi:hypothetical protein